MTIIKRKKSTRQRAGTTHGWGSMKKHRGAGHRGGRGNAGTGKRGDAKKPRIWKEKYFGTKGFTSKSRNIISTTINVKTLDLQAEKLSEKGIVQKKTDIYEINLTKLGIQKLLGGGRVSKKLKIEVEHCSERAKTKIEEAGGQVNLPLIQKKAGSEE